MRLNGLSILRGMCLNPEIDKRQILTLNLENVVF